MNHSHDHARRGYLRLRTPTALVLALGALLLGCPPEGEGLHPEAGAVAYREEARVPFPLAGVQGHVDLLGGNLLLRSVLLSTDTRLGTFEIAAVHNSATGAWTWSFEPRYGASLFHDETGATHAIGALPDGASVPGTRWVKLGAYQMKTRSGRVYGFDLDRRLASLHWGGLRSTRLEWVRALVAGERRTVAVEQCRFLAPCQTVYRFEYDGEGRLAAVEDTGGRRAEVDWANGRLVAIRDGLAVEEGRPGVRYEYAGARVAAVTNGDGERTEVAYEEGRVARVVRRGVGDPSEAFAYASDAEPVPYTTRHTDARGHVRVYRYDALRRLHEVWNVDADEHERWTWEGLRPASHTAPDGATHLFTWQDDELVEERLPNGNRRTTTYADSGTDRSDPPHRPILRREDDLGLLEEHVYDEQGRRTASTNGAGETTVWTYAAEALDPLQMTAPSGRETSLGAWGDHGHPLIVQRSGSIVPAQHRAFDAAGNRVRGATIGATGPGGVVERRYDASRNLREIALLDGESIGIAVRSDGRPVAVTRPSGADHELVYDALGRLAERREHVDGVWQTTRFEYDAADHRTAVERPNGMRREWDHDAAGRIVRIRNLRDGVLEGEAVLEYEDGRLRRLHDSIRGGSESYAYDTAGRVVAVAHADDRTTVYAWDGRDRRTDTVWVETTGAIVGHVERGYDGADREVLLRDGAVDLVARQYAGGRLAEVRYGNGLVRSYQYAPDGGSLEATETRDAAGLVVETTSYARSSDWPGWSVEAETWIATTGWESVERYDLLSRAVPGPGVVLDRPRLTGYRAGDLEAQTSFDGRSNLVDDGGLHFVYNAEANRLLAVEAPGEPALAYAYDEAGFAVLRDGAPLEWYANGRLRRHGGDDFEWDVSGRPLASTVDGVTTRTSWDGGVTTDAAGAPLRADLDEAVLDLASGGRRYRHLDFRQNVKFTSDDAGAVTSLYTYGPFGVAEVLGAGDDPVRFVGRSEVGELMLVGDRVYDPIAGRFLSPDPVFQWVNQFAYTLGNPVQFHDRSGRSPEGQSGDAAEPAVTEAQVNQTIAQSFMLAGGIVTLTGNLAIGTALMLTGLIMLMIAP